MSLERVVAALHAAGVEPQVGDLLDALWLVTRGRALDLHGPLPAAPAVPVPPVPPLEAPATAVPPGGTRDGGEGRGRTPAEAPSPKVQTPVYPSAPVAPEAPTVPAAPAALPAGEPLPGRLHLARALRPLRARRPSPIECALDEEATAQASAELLRAAGGTAPGRAVFPVFAPVPEPWFDAHCVLEDDPAIGLWQDTLAGFTRVLEDTGAFRSVHAWRLRCPAAASGPGAPDAWLEGPAGLRAGTRLLAGAGVRRLIFFVTHGGSAGWLDGRYARVLAPWARSASLTLLHLFERHRWWRGTLGEPHGTCTAREPGAVTAALEVALDWWRVPPDPGPGADPASHQAPALAVPAVPLTPEGLRDWSLTLMARGRGSPVYRLNALVDPLVDPLADPLADPWAIPVAISRRRCRRPWPGPPRTTGSAPSPCSARPHPPPSTWGSRSPLAPSPSRSLAWRRRPCTAPKPASPTSPRSS